MAKAPMEDVGVCTRVDACGSVDPERHPHCNYSALRLWIGQANSWSRACISRSAVEPMWHIRNRQGQMLALIVW